MSIPAASGFKTGSATFLFFLTRLRGIRPPINKCAGDRGPGREKKGTLPIGIASRAIRRTCVTTVLITRSGATLDDRAQNEHHCKLGLQPRAPAPHYGAQFLSRFAHESLAPHWRATRRGITGCDSSRTMTKGGASAPLFAVRDRNHIGPIDRPCLKNSWRSMDALLTPTTPSCADGRPKMCYLCVRNELLAHVDGHERAGIGPIDLGNRTADLHLPFIVVGRRRRSLPP